MRVTFLRTAKKLKNYGNYRLLGQAFSEELGWFVADHGGTEPVAMKPSGELTGNFWSNEIGWINCSSTDVGSGNVQIWNPGSATSTSSSSSTSQSGGGGGGGGGRRPAGTVSHSGSSRSATSTDGNDMPDLPNVRGFLAVEVEGQTVVFKDVPINQWYAVYVWKLLKANIASGYRDAAGHPTGEYGPSNSVTYAEIAKMALESAGKDVSTVTGSPENRSAHGQWSEHYIRLAEELHLSVYTRDLNVNEPATRGAVIQTIVEAFDLPLSESTSDYSDLPTSHSNARAIATATALGIISGDTNAAGNRTGTVRPDDPINRAEVAKIIALMLEVVRP